MTTSEQVPPAPQSERLDLQVGEVLSVGGLSHRRLMALAAAQPDGSDDPVDVATASALREDHPTIAVPSVDPQDVDAASPQRPYSLVRVRQLTVTDGSKRDVVVMRGDLRAVMASSGAGREARTLLRKNASYAVQRGWRPLVIAAAAVADDGTVGEFRLQGFVNLRPTSSAEGEPDADESSYFRVALWSISLRYQHWLNVVLIFVLSCTGYYIMDPFFGPTSASGEPTGYLMGIIRAIHFTAAFCWLIVGLTRIVSAFTSRDRYLRWPVLWPFKSKNDVRNFGRVVKHYAFLKDEPPLYLAHNPLQQLAYTSLYVAAGLQLVTGFVLYGLSNQGNAFWAFVSTPIHWWGVAPIREFHAVLMFLLWAFAIMHIYMAVRADSLERHGGVSSMLNGGVWVRRGSKPIDSPKVG